MQDTLLIILGIIGWLMVAGKLSGMFLAAKFPCMARTFKEGMKERVKNG